ncbi:anti-sigma factor [Trinickia terrae]|uniref:Anti-sigma factor n=1 Tax=Trinickia terrae TaxID=2571161 RepID=A0A4U1I1D6_9BURK|nr:anti-sigma factor [Trinickia terrae]TKC86925.1 anti-sigma factor [Trinickia terrae]
MKVDETLLMAYVDGELPQAQLAEVEAFIAGSAEAAELVKMLRASQADYRAAFEQQALPPLPASLVGSIDALIREHRDAADSPRSAAGAPRRSRLRTVPSWLAAACVAGAFCTGLLLRPAPPAATTVAASGMSPWVTAAADYQSLYTRDTVAYTQADMNGAATVVEDVRAKDHLDVHVPDLSRAGLEFKAIRRLNFHNKPLVQIVYLPKEGPPVALCVIREPKSDAALQARTVDAMQVVTWRQAQLGYALIGKPGSADLEAIGKQIAGRGTGALL